MGTVVVVLILAVIVALIIRSLWKTHRRGGSCTGCNGSCGACADGSHAHHDIEIDSAKIADELAKRRDKRQ